MDYEDEQLEEVEEEVKAPTNEKEFDLFDTPLQREWGRKVPSFDWLGL